jgi:putative nucleotidyltransferase with HDIG domain
MSIRAYIERTFPEIQEIGEVDLREKVVDVFETIMERGGWESLEEIPFTLLIETDINMVQHVREVTRIAMAVGRGRDDINMDHLIAGSLIHDIGKLLEYGRKDGKFHITPFGRTVRHPVSGFHFALSAGLPLEVAHIVMMHSTDVQKIERSPEAVIIYHADFIVFEIEKAKLNAG